MNKHIETLINKFLQAPYNAGLIVVSILLWMLCCYFGYWNKNFDMLSTIETYIIFTSLIAILVGALGADHYRHLIRLGVITQITAIFALVASKSLLVSTMGIWFFTPLSIFCFCLLLKEFWQAVGQDK